MILQGFFTPQVHLKYFYHKETSRLNIGIVLFRKCIFQKTIYLGKKEKKPRKPKPDYMGDYFKKHYKRILGLTKADYIFTGSRFGAENAALTALLTGAIYGLYGSAVSVLSHFLEVRNVNIEVKPVYNRFYFDFRFQCILKFKIANAIKELFRFLVWIIKVKLEAFKNERTSYMRSYDHSYAKH